MNSWSVTAEERNYLRELAKKQLEYSMLPIMKEREERWYKHNDLKGQIPMIHFEIGTCENDLLPAFKCQSDAAVKIELQLYREILNYELIDDDRVVPPWFRIEWDAKMTLFGMEIGRDHASDSKGRTLGYHFRHPIKDLHEDIHMLKPTVYTADKEKTLEWKAFVEEVLGDILTVKLTMGSVDASLSQHLIHLMGMETMLYSMVDYPDDFHEIMGRIGEDFIGFAKWREKEGLLVLNNGNNGVCQGTFGFTHDLPGKDFNPVNRITTRDLWGYADSQETVGVSPEMFDEFFFPAYLKFAEHFGLFSYGCCEPVHPIWEKSLCKLPGLRKISISPWCDEEYMGQILKGSNIIYLRKPSPNFIGVGKELDEDAFRTHILKTIKCAQGCKLEFAFRDVYTLDGNINKPRRAVQIVRNLIEENW